MPVEHASTIDKLLDYVPDFMEKANIIANKTLENRNKKDKKADKEEKKNENIESVKIKKPIKEKKAEEKIEEVEIEYDETNKAEEYLEDE